KIPLDVHLMVENPEKEVPKYYEFEPFVITFHYEATNFPVRLAREIRKNNIKAGISLNPKTPIELIEPFLEEIDLVLVMSVEPGFYGQSFIGF
ncbi:ribulose-phosphate 3-epimerase, partial [Escherichia coli]|nr:ribulose-phosphate 3-epimerase [Escherichia coli]